MTITEAQKKLGGKICAVQGVRVLRYSVGRLQLTATEEMLADNQMWLSCEIGGTAKRPEKAAKR